MQSITMKVRCGKETYLKPDGSVGTAGKGVLAAVESSFTVSTMQDQTLVTAKGGGCFHDR